MSCARVRSITVLASLGIVLGATPESFAQSADATPAAPPSTPALTSKQAQKAQRKAERTANRETNGLSFREVAANTLQDRPGTIERIANRSCLAQIKRQRSFNHDAISSRPTCFGARADGRSKGSCDEVDWRPGRFATAARSLGGYVRHSRKSSYRFVTIRKLLTRCGARMPLTGAEYR